MVEAPLALKATGNLCHTPPAREKSSELPARSMKILNVREPRKQQAGNESTQREHDAAHERLLPKVDESEAGPHNSLL